QRATGNIDGPDLILAVTRGNQREPVAVGRPARTGRRMFVVSQLARLSAAERHQINLRRALVSSFVYVCDREGDQIAFGRGLRVTDAADLQQIINRKM